MTGKIKFYDSSRGFGFISADDGKDYFAHYSQIKTEGTKILIQGQLVEFEPSENEKGLLAKDITVKE